MCGRKIAAPHLLPQQSHSLRTAWSLIPVHLVYSFHLFFYLSAHSGRCLKDSGSQHHQFQHFEDQELPKLTLDHIDIVSLPMSSPLIQRSRRGSLVDGEWHGHSNPLIGLTNPSITALRNVATKSRLSRIFTKTKSVPCT